jgi:hypothetical protein
VLVNAVVNLLKKNSGPWGGWVVLSVSNLFTVVFVIAVVLFCIKSSCKHNCGKNCHTKLSALFRRFFNVWKS